MKIALINGIMDPRKVGGAPISVINLAKNLQKRGHEVTIVSSDKVNIEGVKNIQSTKLTHISFSVLSSFTEIFKMIKQTIYLFKYYKHTTKLLEKYDFDIIDNHGFWCANQDVITVRYCVEAYFKKSNKIILPNSLKRFLLNKIDFRIHLLRKIEKDYYKNKKYKKIVAVSSKVKKELIKYHNVPSSKIEVINNAFDTKKFTINPKKYLRKKFNIKNEIVLSFIGGNLKRKNLKLVYDLLDTIYNKNIKLLIVGNKNIILPKRHKDKVIVLPWVDKIEEIFSITDIFIFPTLYDTCAKVVIEAMAMGCCVVTTYESGCEDFITDGSGFIVNTNKEFIEKVNYLLRNPKLIKSIGNVAKKKVLNLTWEENSKKFESVYLKIS